METKKSKKENHTPNYYKISTIILMIILLIIAGYFLYASHIQNVTKHSMLQGQDRAINTILQNIDESGHVTINLQDNKNLTLVTLNDAKKLREDTILEIMNYVNEEGSVTIYNNQTEMTLVPYQDNTQNTNDMQNVETEQTIAQ